MQGRLEVWSHRFTQRPKAALASEKLDERLGTGGVRHGLEKLVFVFWTTPPQKKNGGSISGTRDGLSAGLRSADRPERSAGAEVQELELANERLHFRLLRGVGPKEGWVSLRLKAPGWVKTRRGPREGMREGVWGGGGGQILCFLHVARDLSVCCLSFFVCSICWRDLAFSFFKTCVGFNLPAHPGNSPGVPHSSFFRTGGFSDFGPQAPRHP